MAVFDMDKTILNGSFIQVMADKYSFRPELENYARTSSSPFIRIKQIAQLIKGISFADIVKTAEDLPIVEDTQEVIRKLQSKGYLCGIISESYDVVVNHIANKLGMDFSLGNELEIRKSTATGEVKIPSFFLNSKHSVCTHDYCKSNALVELSRRYGLPLKKIIATGNGKNDICMVKNAGVGIAFCTDNKILARESDYHIVTPAFSPVLNFSG